MAAASPGRHQLSGGHLTLFHHLPEAELAAVRAHLLAVARATGPLPLRVAGLCLLARGAAFNLTYYRLRAEGIESAAGPGRTVARLAERMRAMQHHKFQLQFGINSPFVGAL